MNTFQEFFNFISKLTPIGKTGDPFNLHKIPNSTIGIAICSNYTQVNVINTETGIGIINIYFHLRKGEVDIIPVDQRTGQADHGATFTIPMTVGVEPLSGGMISMLGLQHATILKGVLDHIEEISEVESIQIVTRGIEDYVYLLANPSEVRIDAAAHLVGRAIRVKYTEEQRMVSFVDANNGELLCIVCNAGIVDSCKEFDKRFLTIHSDVGIHRLLRVDEDLYYQLKGAIESSNTLDDVPDLAGNSDIPLKVIDRKSKGNGDLLGGYSEVKFTFNRDATIEEFIEFLVKCNYRLKKTSPGSKEHSELSGDGNIWIYKWISMIPDTHR